MIHTNLRTKFLLYSTLLILVFTTILSLFYYQQTKSMIIKEALEKSELILSEVEAMRDYVKEVLRPKMYELHGRDTFIIEAMSTTYVSLNIMKRFHEKKSAYQFRRVSQNPHNPANLANRWEDELFDWFSEDTTRDLWQGQKTQQGESFFVSSSPDYMEKACLQCHGRAEDAPATVLERYGGDGGFRFKEGDLAGIDSVFIPISRPLAKLNKTVAIIFIITLATSFLLLITLNFLFDRLVLSRIVSVLSSINAEDKPETTPAASGNKDAQPQQGDELDSLRHSFKNLDRYVQTARKGSGQQENFIGPYVIEHPVAAGAMSWLHKGFHSESRQSVSMKIPFNNIYENPLYRACYQTESKILRHCNHPHLLTYHEKIEDIVIAQAIDEYKAFTPLNVPPSQAQITTILTQLFDLVATLHVNGIVIHNLWPGNILINPQSHILLFDLGLAYWSRLPDTIFESGIGPQGEYSYSAPEQLKGLRGDARSDIYSVGVLLYELFCCCSPFAGHDKQPLTLTSQKRTFISPQKMNSALSPDLARVISKAMAYRLHDRYQWIEDLRDDLFQHL